jgi:hypothetical protein
MLQKRRKGNREEENNGECFYGYQEEPWENSEVEQHSHRKQKRSNFYAMEGKTTGKYFVDAKAEKSNMLGPNTTLRNVGLQIQIDIILLKRREH